MAQWVTTHRGQWVNLDAFAEIKVGELPKEEYPNNRFGIIASKTGQVPAVLGAFPTEKDATKGRRALFAALKIKPVGVPHAPAPFDRAGKAKPK